MKVETLRDPQKDEDRVKKPEWLVMIGMLLYSYNCLNDTILIDMMKASAHTWDACPLVKQATTEDGSVLATALTTIFPDVYEGVLRL